MRATAARMCVDRLCLISFTIVCARAFSLLTCFHPICRPPAQMNWYSKRALAASVYAATELYMLTDRSFAHADTWAFLDRRLEDVMMLGKVQAHARDAAAAALTGVAALAAQGVPAAVGAVASFLARGAHQQAQAAHEHRAPAEPSGTPPPAPQEPARPL